MLASCDGRRPMTVAALALVWCFLGCRNTDQGGPTQGATDFTKHTLTATRLAGLENAILKGRGLVACRAVQESAWHINENPVLAKAILSSFPKHEGAYTHMFGIVALGNTRGPIAQEVIRSYQEASADKRQFLLFVFGRMGPEAQPAEALLRGESASPALDPEMRMSIKVVLARMGRASTAEMDEIARAVMAGDRPGRAVLRIMAASGRNDWVTPAIKTAIVRHVQSVQAGPETTPDSDVAIEAICALGTLGAASDEDVRNALARATETAKRSEDSIDEYAVAFPSLAKADPRRRRGVLLDGFSGQPAIFSFYAGDCAVLLELLCAGITDHGFIEDLIFLLHSSNPQVSLQAANALRVIGPPAHRAVPELLRLVQSAGTKEARIAAAEALGAIADPSCVDEMRKIGLKSAPDLTNAIEQSVRAILLGGE
ncbi:MAG: HEAT repeat domain-containing protein [Planctomycetota bacterium]|nr:HEAT repeat domain-containing protein [Planctomycetota bacterium]